MLRSLLLALLCVASILCLPSLSSAQTVTGTLQGTVSDSKGAVVPGADVVVLNAETGQVRNLKANGDGFYVASFLPLGRYKITASQTGFTSVTQENVEITLNQTRVINLTLNPSGVRVSPNVGQKNRLNKLIVSTFEMGAVQTPCRSRLKVPLLPRLKSPGLHLDQGQKIVYRANTRAKFPPFGLRSSNLESAMDSK
jgi:hypothetical protein